MLKRHGLKKGLSLLLVLCLILSLMPVTALAEELEESQPVVETQEDSSGETADTNTPEDSETPQEPEEAEPSDTPDAAEPAEGTSPEEEAPGTGEADQPTETEAPVAPEEEEKSELDEIKDAINDSGILDTITGELTEEEKAALEAQQKADEEAQRKAEEEAARLAAEEEAARLAAEEAAQAAALAEVLSIAEDEEPRDTSGDEFYKIVHLDAGRKYFSPENIKAIIDTMADAGYNQLELYLSDNQGFRFELDNMVVKTDYGTYDLSGALGDGVGGGDGSGQYLTQTEMTDIIRYANKKGIEIVPSINTPGHMGAILAAFPEFKWNSSNSLNIEDAEAVAFALALLEKYVDYFAGEGCEFFNIGADEFANDIYSSGGMGFGALTSAGKYQYFVDYVNAAAQTVINAGMTPRAFNDGLYYNNNTSVSFNEAIQVCYWSSGWSSYRVASAQTIADKGHEMINTHGDYYWVLGGTQCSASKAAGFDYESFPGGTIESPEGAMFCIWCDAPATDGADGGDNVVAQTADVITAFGATLPVPESGNGTLENPYDLAASKNANVLENLLPGAVVYVTVGTEVLWQSGDESVIRVESADAKAAALDLTEGDGEPAEEAAGVTATVAKLTAVNAGSAVITAGDESYPVTVDYEEATITVTVGKSTAIPAEAGTTVNKEDTDSTIATVGTPQQVGTGWQPVSSIVSGGKYLLVNQDSLLTTTTSYNSSTSGLACVSFNGDGNKYDAYLWTINAVSGGYTIQAANGQYLNIASSSGNGNVTLSQTAQTLTIQDLGEYFTIAHWSTYLDRFNASFAAGWGGDGAGASNKNEQWYLYEYKTGYEIPVTGKAVGTTSVIVGNTKYTIQVVEEDLSLVTPLKVEYWITNGRPTDSQNRDYYSVSAEVAYSEDGITVTSFLPANTAKEGRTLEYWRCRLLDKTVNNSSTKGTQEQTVTAGDDETYSGTGFTKVRYWQGAWAVYTDNNAWVPVAENHQLVAYYLEILPISDELVVTAADWGKKGDGTTSGDYLAPQTSCTISIQVVYEDGTTNPGGTTAADLGSRTIAYGYWEDGRGIGTLNLIGLEGYQIWKVEAETGAESYASSSSDWGSFTVNSFTWDGNAMTVYEGDPVDSYTIHNDAHSPSKSGYYANLTWDENFEAILIKIYVKAKPTQNTLKVVYFDEKFNDTLYSYDINVGSNVTFAAITPEPGTFTGNTNRIDVNGCGIENNLGVTQKFQTDLTKVPEAIGKYNSDLYRYTGSVISEDGKTLYLYYDINTEALSPMFVADFGLPIKFELSDVTNTPALVKSVSGLSAKYGDLTYDSTQKEFTYTPDTILKGIDILSIAILFQGESTATTTNVGVMPATTVYYEQGFAAYDGGWTNTNYTGTSAQTTEVWGERVNNYGYDPAYNNAAESAAVSTTVGDSATFTFTGTGVDIYANCGSDTGMAMIVVTKGNATVRMLAVDTAMLAGATTVTAANKQSVTAQNIPIASIDGLAHGEYTVTIYHVAQRDSTVKPIKLDGFRVHGTLENDSVYEADQESNISMQELRDAVLKLQLNATGEESNVTAYRQQIANLANNQVYKAAIISGVADATQDNAAGNLQDLLDNGPKNEIYLAPNETLMFKVSTSKNVQVGAKVLTDSASCTIDEKAVTSKTDMFYTVTPSSDGTVTITNTGTGILSITELKLTK